MSVFNIRIRLISVGLETVLSLTKNSCIMLYQFSSNNKIIELIPILLARAV